MKKTKKNTKKKCCKKAKKGFTLVELLVVIAIIGILAGIVLVSLNTARDRAKKASLQSTLASASTIAMMCLNEGGGVNAVDYTTPGAICDDDTIVEGNWPALPSNLNGWDYSVDSGDTMLTGTDDTAATVVTCSLSTGSCTLQ